MKKYIIAMLALCVTASVFGQGTLAYSTRVTGVIDAKVYGTQTANPSESISGNTATQTPAGAAVYTGTPLQGTGWYAQLFYGAQGAAESSLVAVPGTLTTFRTGGTLGGTPVPSTVTFAGIPGGTTLTFQLRAWDNVNQTLGTWAAAEAAWLAGNIAAGKSVLFDVGLLEPPALPPNMTGFRSFNVYTTAIVPEPSSFALLGLGALGMLIFRRK